MDDSTYKIEKDSQGRITKYGTANGDYWWTKVFDDNDNCVYYEDSMGVWVKKEFNAAGEEIFYQNSFGVIRKQ